MTLPLHHCCAIGCTALVDPGTHMCAAHERLVSDEVARLIVTAKSPEHHESAWDLAMLDVALAEGRIEGFFDPGSPFPADPDYAHNPKEP